MGLFKRKQEEDEFSFETSDLLIVFDNEKRTSSINYVTYIDDESVTAAGKNKVPIADCEVTTGKDGRNFFYRAPSQSITETERLARLEASMVLTQITAYKEPVQPASMDWTKGMLFGLLVIAFVVIGLGSCSV